MFPAQTPTPTRFLQNCEEVGLFKEIEEEFLQAQEEEKNKQVHKSKDYYWIFYNGKLYGSVRHSVDVCFIAARNLLARSVMVCLEWRFFVRGIKGVKPN